MKIISAQWQMLAACCVLIPSTLWLNGPPAIAQTATSESASSEIATDPELNSAGISALQLLHSDDLTAAMNALSVVAERIATNDNNPSAVAAPAVAAAAGGLHRRLAQLSGDEQYERLHKWSMPEAGRDSVRVLSILVPHASPPPEFARALGERPNKQSFAIAAVGEIPGIFCSAWMMVLAADDSGNLRQLITELEGHSAKQRQNAEFVLLLAKIRDGRSRDDELQTLLTARVKPEEDSLRAASMSDAVLAAAAMRRSVLGPIAEQIAERLNQFDFTQGTSSQVPFLRCLRARIILKNRSPQTDPDTIFHTPPQLWIAADEQVQFGNAAAIGQAIWLTHEEHIKRLAGPGDDLLLFRYPLTGQFELKGEATALDHGAVGMTYGGLAFDANSQTFTVKEVQRARAESRPWPFVAPKELRMFNRVNIRSDGDRITFLSNLHPGWNAAMSSCSSCPWLGLRASGDGRPYFRNLELIGQPQIPREVRLSDSPDLRGWTATCGESVPTVVAPFPHQPVVAPADQTLTDWYTADGIVHGRKAVAPEADGVSQSHLVYMRPLLSGESLSYEYFYNKDQLDVHPALGRLAFLIEAEGVRLHWLTDASGEWTGLPDDNAIIEPLNRRGPRNLPLKNAEWNSVTLKLTDDIITVSLNGEEIYQRSVDLVTNRHIGFYRDRKKCATQIRNVVLSGDWPQQLTAEQLQKLVALTSD